MYVKIRKTFPYSCFEIVMVRRTKAEAEQTRHAVLDAAERLFHSKGVSEIGRAHV